MADDLRANLDQLFLQARQRPILDGLRRRQRAQEVAEIVGECMKLKANRAKSLNPKSKGNRSQNHRSRANTAFGRAAFVA
jgi:hypothetical protein